MARTIEINSRMDYQKVMRDIGKLGVLRVDSQYMKNGETYVTLHERTWGEWFREAFVAKPKDLAQTRQSVVDALAPLIERKARPPEQLLQNIRDRAAHGVDITGRALQRDFQPVTRGSSPLPLQGGTIVARASGVHVKQADPAKIKCDLAVLQTSTALAEAARHPALASVAEQLRESASAHQSLPLEAMGKPIPVKTTQHQVGLAAPAWTCFTDLQIPAVGTNRATLSSAILGDLLEQAVRGASGAVVIEVIPDQAVEQHDILTRSYSDAGLVAQMQAAWELVNDAKGKLGITFACKDRAVLERMQALDEDTLQLREANRQRDVRDPARNIPRLDDDSDSESQP